MIDPTLKDGITLAIAIVGAVLGILNAWRSLVKDRVKLLVIPSLYFVPNGPKGISIEVINMGFVPVTVTQVGIRLRRPKKHNFVILPGYLNGQKLPHRLEPRSSITLCFPPDATQDDRLVEGVDAYAETACNCTFRGNSPALKSQIRSVRERFSG